MCNDDVTVKLMKKYTYVPRFLTWTIFCSRLHFEYKPQTINLVILLLINMPYCTNIIVLFELHLVIVFKKPWYVNSYKIGAN